MTNWKVPKSRIKEIRDHESEMRADYRRIVDLLIDLAEDQPADSPTKTAAIEALGRIGASIGEFDYTDFADEEH